MARKMKRPNPKFVGHHAPEVAGTTTVGERGQVVIPAEARRTLRLKPGDRLIVLVKDGAIGLVRAEAIRHLVSDLNRQLGRLR